MPDDKKKPRHPEVNFLPPLDMVLSFFKRDKPVAVDNQSQAEDEVQGHAVKRIIDHINHDEQQTKKLED